jgi:glutathione S-transferase
VLRTAPPVFVRGLFSFVASKIEDNFLNRNFVDHLDFLENQLRSAPGGGPFLTGQKLAVADIMMSYPVLESMTRIFGVQKGITKERYPLLSTYAARLQERKGYQRAVAKIVAIEGHVEAC